MKKRKLLSIILMMVAVLMMSLNTQAAVKISKKKATLIKGQSITLRITGTKKKAKWTTSKKNVATVTQKGVVKAREKGTAIINAKIGKKTYKCTVKVETPRISKTKATLGIGKKLKLAIAGNSQKIKWTSNNKYVATVTTNGIVTGKKEGTAVITGIIAKKRYSCKITVKEVEYEELVIPDDISNNATVSQQNAVRKAESYLKYSAFSRDGLIEQLEYEKFTNADATYGADHCGANWNEQAIKKAESYLKYSAFSRDGLIEQLEYEKFTTEQANYGVNHITVDWNDQAAKKAESYLKYSAFSRDGLIDQLKYEGFTVEQATYGVNAVGL